MHFFLFIAVIFKRLQSVIDFVILHRISCVNQLMPGGNVPGAWLMLGFIPVGLFKHLLPFFTIRHYRIKCQVIFIFCFKADIFKGLSFCIFFLQCQSNTRLQKFTRMLCHRIVHITFQWKHNYIVSMILQISVQSGSQCFIQHFNMSRKLMCVNLSQLNNWI